MNQAVDMLNTYNHQLSESVRGLLATIPARWNALKTRVSLAKQQLGPKIQEESEQILKVFPYIIPYMIAVLTISFREVRFEA